MCFSNPHEEILLMEEIMLQLIGSQSHYVHVVWFPRWLAGFLLSTFIWNNVAGDAMESQHGSLCTAALFENKSASTIREVWTCFLVQIAYLRAFHIGEVLKLLHLYTDRSSQNMQTSCLTNLGSILWTLFFFAVPKFWPGIGSRIPFDELLYVW